MQADSAPITAREAAAYKQGVTDVLALAIRTADALEAAGRRPLHHGFAIASLRALADEAGALIGRAAQRPEERQ